MLCLAYLDQHERYALLSVGDHAHDLPMQLALILFVVRVKHATEQTMQCSIEHEQTVFSYAPLCFWHSLRVEEVLWGVARRAYKNRYIDL